MLCLGIGGDPFPHALSPVPPAVRVQPARRSPRWSRRHSSLSFISRECSRRRPHSNGVVSSVSFVSTTNTARSLAGCVSLALALTPWRSPGSSEKLCPAS